MRTLRLQRGWLTVEDDGKEPARYPPSEYARIIEETRRWGVEHRDEAMQAPVPPLLKSSLEPRDYQAEALASWVKAGRRGVVVLPTGAGKTVVAIKAMEEAQVATLVVVPTLVLLDQWKKTLEEALSITVGSLGGGAGDIQPVTVATYDSAALRAGSIGDLFRLIVFDEVHHLPAPTNRRIASHYLAPMRLGLTATLGPPEAEEELADLVGPVVYRRGVEELAGRHLSDYTVKTIQVPLTPAEKLEYDRQYAVYRGFLQRRGIVIRSSQDYLRFVRRSGVDPEARRALLARNAAMDVALNSRGKTSYLRGILQANPDAKTLVFTRHNKLVYKVSRELLIPAITHQTTPEERQVILDKFRSSSYRRIITSQVLDEGVDVPDANLAVILSGTGSSRQFIQRLGRVLRKREGKQAVLVELVSMETAETRLSQRRKQA